jgi:hypothetical protein
METQNVTLAVPKDILHELKLFAKQRKMSFSRYIISLLEKEVYHQKEYEEAMCHSLERLGKYDLGTHGKIPWKREELHARN